MMAALVLAASSFALRCEMVDVDPLLGSEGKTTYSVSLVAGDDGVAVSGWQERLGDQLLSLHAMPGGEWTIEGPHAASAFSTKTFARLKPAQDSSYFLEWGVAEQRGQKDQWTFSEIARGRCKGSPAAQLEGSHK